MDVVFGAILLIWVMFGVIAIATVLYVDYLDSKKFTKKDED